MGYMGLLQRGYRYRYVGVDVFTDGSFGCLKGACNTVQALFNGIEAVMVLTLIILK